MKLDALGKRLAVLEARQTSSTVSGDRWPPADCDPKRRLAKYAAYFENRRWECVGTPERRARRDADLARYQKYFEELEEDDGGDHEKHERRLAALEGVSETEDPMVLDFIFPPAGIRRSRFRFKWENHILVMWAAEDNGD